MIQADELEEIPIFRCLTNSQRQRMAANAAELNVQTGEWIVREGESPFFFVLLAGALEVEKEYGGESRVRGRYKPGDFYGETPILLDAPTIASLRATEPSRLVRLDRNQFKELIDSSPGMREPGCTDHDEAADIDPGIHARDQSLAGAGCGFTIQ